MEAVEAAAKTFYGAAWDDCSPEDLEYALGQMRETLEAAAPHLMAHAWDGGRDATIRAVMSGDDYPTNPYMLNNEGEK